MQKEKKALNASAPEKFKSQFNDTKFNFFFF